jgi:prevent-host-death family protein
MKRIALQDAKARFGELVELSREQPVLITRNGQEAAVLVPAASRGRVKLVQGRRGATDLLAALRACPGELKIERLRGKFRSAKL